MNIAHLQTNSKIYGPGHRYVIWVQGCSLRCSGCWNKEMWSFKTKNERAVANLLIDIEAHSEEIEGITILGGEPLEQFEEVLKLCKSVHDKNLSVMLFTGYEMEEIQQANQSEILNYLDILITGRYEETKRNTNLQWIGSENQEIHFLSDRYQNFVVDDGNYVEIHLDKDGGFEILGFPELGIEWI